MEIDVLIRAASAVGVSFFTTVFIYWWCCFTVDKISNRVIHMIVFFIPIIPILVAGTYLILVSR